MSVVPKLKRRADLEKPAEYTLTTDEGEEVVVRIRGRTIEEAYRKVKLPTGKNTYMYEPLEVELGNIINVKGKRYEVVWEST